MRLPICQPIKLTLINMLFDFCTRLLVIEASLADAGTRFNKADSGSLRLVTCPIALSPRKIYSTTGRLQSYSLADRRASPLTNIVTAGVHEARLTVKYHGLIRASVWHDLSLRWRPQ